MDQFRGYRRSAVANNVETRQGVVLELRELNQQADHRRHKDRVSDPFTLDRLEEGLRAELRDGDLAGAERRRPEHERKVGDVKHRRRMKVDATLFIRHPIVGVVQVLENIRVGKYNPFWMPGCTARVDESQDRLRIVDGLRI